MFKKHCDADFLFFGFLGKTSGKLRKKRKCSTDNQSNYRSYSTAVQSKAFALGKCVRVNCIHRADHQTRYNAVGSLTEFFQQN